MWNKVCEWWWKLKRDNCQFCLGAKGGVKGNENRIGGVVVCDYCTILIRRISVSGERVFCDKV